MLLLHVLLLTYWLGADLGVFYSSRYVLKPELGSEARATALKIMAWLDVSPRLCLVLFLPSGVTLMALDDYGRDIFLGWPLALVWVASAVWFGLVVADHVLHDSPLQATVKRLDLLESDRHVVVSLDGLVLADSRRAVVVHETHLPARWYLPAEDARLDLLDPSASRTTCAYKGDARYWSLPARDGRPGAEDVAWSYPDPLPEAERLRGLVCFYAERTDLRLDGDAVPRPVTPWSSPADQERT